MRDSHRGEIDDTSGPKCCRLHCNHAVEPNPDNPQRRDGSQAARKPNGRPAARKMRDILRSPRPLGFQPMPCGYSLRGHCPTERRKARWFGHPKGIVSSSPGLPSPRGYPGLASVRLSTPTGLCPITTTGPQPRWGWPTPPAFPRVARGSQPWALGRNPFGIQRC